MAGWHGDIEHSGFDPDIASTEARFKGKVMPHHVVKCKHGDVLARYPATVDIEAIVDCTDKCRMKFDEERALLGECNHDPPCCQTNCQACEITRLRALISWIYAETSTDWALICDQELEIQAIAEGLRGN